MTGLISAGPFATEYTSDESDISSVFVNPCLEASNRYDRITGYFASSVFALTYKSLRPFILQNEGQVRIVCSPRVSEKDASQIEYGYVNRGDSELHQSLKKELDEILNSPSLLDAARLLAVLIATGRLDLRIARVEPLADASIKRMFHDKVGVFRDSRGDGVGFRGSMNETFQGLAPIGNIESVDVWPSWEKGRDAMRYENARARFDRIWNGEAAGVEVTRLPSETIKALEAVAGDMTLEEALRAIQNRGSGPDSEDGGRSTAIAPRNHQRIGLSAWRANGQKGILRHATGAGKTMSALFAVKEALEHGLVPLVVVPSVELLNQWATEIAEKLDKPSLLCGGGNSRWRSDNLLRAVVEHRGSKYIVITTDATMRTNSFRSQIGKSDESLFLIFDEVHNAGASRNRGALEDLRPTWRLGLSATPERAGDTGGTEFLMKYFGGVVHEYGLDEAISDGVLVPYTYEPFFVRLTAQEQEEWDEISDQIGRLVAMSRSPNPPPWVEEHLGMRRIERAHIAKRAIGKVPQAVRIIKQHYEPHSDQKWLVYCDGIQQLNELRSALSQASIRSWEFHSQMSGDRKATLESFDESGGIIVAIKCLDEGIDIPSATHAVILASSRNPREFIQRRGRVLRRAEGKAMAHIRDAIVLPMEGSVTQSPNSLVVGELARAMSFSKSSLSPNTETVLEAMWVDLGYSMSDLDEVALSGFEPEGQE